MVLKKAIGALAQTNLDIYGSYIMRDKQRIINMLKKLIRELDEVQKMYWKDRAEAEKKGWK
tara:strand:- start:491 stop:673 length:183 start_codon:yes stop_codon:yes gene_type:complete